MDKPTLRHGLPLSATSSGQNLKLRWSMNIKELAGIQYMGLPATTSDCVAAIAKLVHFGDTINWAKLISCKDGNGGDHCFILNINHGYLVAIKSGFTSGYMGEGPRGLSVALQLLARHGVEIEEYIVKKSFIDKIDASCLRSNDLEELNILKPVRPARWWDYIHEKNRIGLYSNHDLKDILPLTIPFSLVDFRLMDLALKLEDDYDNVIGQGYRRLEDIVRKRTGLVAESGSRLMARAFQGEKSILYWNDIDGGEHNGKGTLFTSVFNAFRNRRAHREIDSNFDEAMREFLLINELFILESKSIARPAEDDSGA